MSVNNNSGNYSRLRKKKPKIVSISPRKERNLSIKKVSVILQKEESSRTKEEKELLFNYSEIVKEAALRIEKRRQLKERLKEIEDSESVLNDKCKQLAEAIRNSEYLVVYTGAGISTAARIPDYRGASGIWTLLQQGKDIGTHDLTQADPTFTHMALFQLYSSGKLKHIVSQNCDGLHLRSGLPKRALSEVHGNMYIEVCKTCKPIVEYLRLFDVTENTARYNHKTMRRCYKCNSSLVDSIVHFGERGNLPWPLNWKGACKAAEKADMILCIGSSLKVLKRYPWLWCMDKPAKRRPHIYIVNLQWTPKDCQATIKINGKCDIVMEKLMKYLSITVPKYSRKFDPIFEHATVLCKEEIHTKNRPFLMPVKVENNLETKEIKTQEHVFQYINKVKTEETTFDVPIKNEPLESCVTSCKKEILIDTGQGDNVKCVKKELIVITIRSGGDCKVCCNLFKINQNHDCECPNFVDEQNDIPVIIEDDLLGLNKNLELPTKLDCSVSDSETDFIKNESSCNKSVFIKDANAQVNSNVLHNLNLSEGAPKVDVARELPYSKRKCAIKKSNCSEKKAKLSSSKNASNFPNNPSVLLETQICTRRRKNISISEGSSQLRGVVDCVKNSLKCSFCSDQYLSKTCLFYLKREPIFKTNFRVCDCCSSDEGEEKTEIVDDKTLDSQTRTNPGWYGKGLRKNFRKKR